MRIQKYLQQLLIQQQKESVANYTMELAGTEVLLTKNLFQLCKLLSSQIFSTNQNKSASERKVEHNISLVQRIACSLGLTFVLEREEGNVCFADHPDLRSEFKQTFTPIDLLDYVYALVNSTAYNQKYNAITDKELAALKYTSNPEILWPLVALGTELRQLHLFENPEVQQSISQYPVNGSDLVEDPKFELASNTIINTGSALSIGRVYINHNQYFDSVPEIAWELYLGGLQPAKKWLYDRKDDKLSINDILHYQKMITALTKSYSLIQQIEKLAGD
jgi:hypothetical protein